MINELLTEMRNPRSLRLGSMNAQEIATLMNQEDKRITLAVEKEIPKIATLAEHVVESFLNGGRLIYIGAGTSGRLGILDAVECWPTFGVSEEMVIGLIAGGDSAFLRAMEGAEDSAELGKQDLIDIHLQKQDIVIGLAASGRTPYVIGALEYAKQLGANTGAISCTPHAAISQYADVAIELAVGAEVLTGSTRLAAGTAQKMVLNMISTASMVGIGKVYENLMVDVQQTNFKLIERAKNIIIQALNVDYQQAEQVLQEANNNPKIAIIMQKADLDYETAKQALDESNGFVEQAIYNKLSK